MHITTLQSKQTYQVYVAAGTLLHLSLGQIAIQTAPSGIDAYAYSTQISLPEGCVYTVERSGWIQIHAQQRSEILMQLPEPNIAVRFWRTLRAIAIRRIQNSTGRHRLN